MGVKTQVFSLGDYRRKQLGSAKDLPLDYFTYGMLHPFIFLLSILLSHGAKVGNLPRQKPYVGGSEMDASSLFLTSSRKNVVK
jgi:hypothetical protein